MSGPVRMWMRLLFGLTLLPSYVRCAAGEELPTGHQEAVTLYREADRFITVVPGLLTKDQCDHLIDLAKRSHTEESRVGEQSNYDGRARRANSTFLMLGYWKDAINQQVANNILQYLDIPERYWEPLQITHYVNDGFYARHSDGHWRQVTALVYLNDVEPSHGGETVFFVPGGDVEVRPELGKVVLFSSSLAHESRPLLGGEKWVANQWIGWKQQGFGMYYIIPLLLRCLPLRHEMMALHRALIQHVSVSAALAIYNALGLMLFVLPGFYVYRRVCRRRQKATHPSAENKGL
eukprot:TRINITY_DN19837_c0_g2_i1.p1 TRINITY_DN19837_c0_g2~~TRINITY_DN19837_c0_g2_i1.p1  ORF type:complete len:292 (-),score=21.38 TRINITY_DN19837_c0_g2_i1:574-1449(-)